MFLGDFHVHSNFSDGRHSIPEIVDYFGSRGISAIAITDHVCDVDRVIGRASAYLGCSLTESTFPLYQEILKSEKERAWDLYRMVVIPGLELTLNSISNHRSAHVLALGVEKFIKPEGDCTEWIKRIHDAGGLAVAAHPVWTRKAEKQTFHLWSRREELASHFDAWEVASGPHIFPEVRDSGLPVLANSDFHRKAHMTSWKTSFSCSLEQSAVLNAIKKQEIGFHFYEEKLPVLNHPVSGSLELGSWGNSLGNLVRA